MASKPLPRPLRPTMYTGMDNPVTIKIDTETQAIIRATALDFGIQQHALVAFALQAARLSENRRALNAWAKEWPGRNLNPEL